MAGVAQLADEHYRAGQRLSRTTAVRMATLWSLVDPSNIVGSWAGMLGQAVALLTSAQVLGASSADAYVSAAAMAQGLDPTPAGRIRPASFGGVGSDGRGLATLLMQPQIRTLELIGAGAPVRQALAAGGIQLDMITRTQVADAGRTAAGTAIAARAAIGGYTRMLNPPACARCILLAGRWFRWNRGFARHPRCDCRHIPCAEDTADEVRTSPTKYFASLPIAEQDRVFGTAGAAAIRDGADLVQVVNARRGMTTATIGGRTVQATTEGTTKSGLFGGYRIDPVTGALRRRSDAELVKSGRYMRTTAVRLMPEEIYRIAGDRTEAIRLLRVNAYIW